MKTALIVGASRNLGFGIAREYARRGWNVIGTVRGPGRTDLHDLADVSDGRVTVEQADVTVAATLTGLRDRIADRELDLLFVNAGIAGADEPAAEVATEVFSAVMVTNALGPMLTVETLRPLVRAGGTIGVMSSRQGSVSLNTQGGHEVYRASKSALNQLMRGYAVRHPDEHTLLLIHPGWVQTGLGGPGAPLTMDESVPGIVDTIETHAGEPGLQFRDHRDDVVPW
ncbi:SDR family oxidoreductase [Actinomadura sp. DC4]|uniref:SDR family oxidoreductase n=1 Tax=Actinomadura sp. DC4 TaxID=3055069 RepID=UPI0025AFA7E4|nr:SDR family oxidoreductase [Actinomadura sp. DC4]MDN3357407.1 SDR family oxidoreductase [Actinomadura sp. DC4]